MPAVAYLSSLRLWRVVRFSRYLPVQGICAGWSQRFPLESPPWLFSRRQSAVQPLVAIPHHHANDGVGARVRGGSRRCAVRPSPPYCPRPPFLRVSGLAFLSTRNRSLRPRKSPRTGRSKSTSIWMNINRPFCQFHLPAAPRSSLRKGTPPTPFCRTVVALRTPRTKNPLDFAHDMLYYCYTWTDKNTSVAVPPWVRKRSPAVRGSRARHRFPMEKSYA